MKYQSTLQIIGKFGFKLNKVFKVGFLLADPTHKLTISPNQKAQSKSLCWIRQLI